MKKLNAHSSLTSFPSLRVGLVAIILMIGAGFTLAASWNAFGLFSSARASAESLNRAAASAPRQELVIGTCDTGMNIEVEANGTSTGYASLTAAFAAINAGTHTGAIIIEVCISETEPAGSAVLNSGDAAPANYTSVNIHPLADGLTISGASIVGKGLIELNGADNVTIDGDNPNTAGTNRNLTLTNTSTSTNGLTSVVRLAVLAATVTSADNDTVKNLNLIGSATGRNISTATSTTGSENTSFGIYVGGNGGATAPTALTSVTANTAPSGTTANAFTVMNNTITACARAVVFNGAAATVSTGVTISNNLIGDQSTLTGNPPFTTPTTTVYTKGILVAGTTAITISGNTVKNILSYVATAMAAIELNSVIGAGPITISDNTIAGVVLNVAAGNSARGISVLQAGGPYTISGNNISNIQNFCNSTTITNQPNGIFAATTATSATIEKNRVSTIYDRNTGTFGVAGVFFNGGNNITFRNNFVWDVNQDWSGGAAFSTTFGAFGVRIAAGTGHKIYHNSINMFGPIVGTSASSLLSAAFAVVSTAQTGMDVRNNIFANTLTGGTTSIAHVSLYLPIGGTSAMNLTLNNNDYFSGPDAVRQGIAQTGTTAGTGFFLASNFDPTQTTPATNLRAYTSTLSAAGTNDNASKVVNPAFASNTDLHLVGSSPMIDMGVDVSVTDDIDLQTRPNGALPDIGADEFYPAPGVLSFSSATYSGNEGTTATITVTRASGSSGTVSVDVTVSNGTATGGAACGAGVDFINPGLQTLTFGDTVTTQSFNIQLCSDAVVDPNETINFSLSNATGGATIGSPSSAVLTITDVPPPFNGSVSVGTGQTYTSLTNPGGMFEALNLGGASGNVTINITSDLTGETGSVPLNQVAGGFSVTIKPSGAARSITSTGSAVSVIKLNDADNVTIDGSLSGGTDRSLSITNTNTAASTTVIWLGSATNGAQNNTIKNLNLAGGQDQSLANVFNFGIISSTSASILTGGSDNDNNTYSNNFIRKVSVGIISIGGLATNMNESTTISNNLIGPAAFGSDEVSTLGVLIFNENAPSIVGNEFRFIGDAATTGGSSGRDHVGISMCTGSASWGGGTAPTIVGVVTNANVSRNLIHDITERATFSAVGIVNNCPNGTLATNNTIANNMIYNILANGTTPDQAVGIGITNGNGDKVVYNSVYMTGDLDPGTSSTSTVSSFGISVATTTPTNLTLKDNISVMDLTSNTATLLHAAINIPSTTYAWGTGGSDFNDWFAGPSTQARVGATGGSGGTFYATLAAWQTATTQDANSKSVDPLFVSATNLHLQSTSTLINMGTPIAGVTTDFDNQTRDATPDIGADEFVVLVPGTLQLSAATYSVGEAAGNLTVTVNRTGGTDGAVAVNYSLTNGTATGGAACGAGVDFVNTGGTVNFANGQASNTFLVPICNDAVFEGNETFNITLSGATGGATIGAQSSAVATIVDDEVAAPGTVQFSSPTYTVGESGGTASITVNRTGGSDGAVSVDYATVAGGTATGGASCGAGVDYVTTSGTLNWTNGDSAPKSFNVTICSDALNEASETVNLALSNATGGATIGAQSTAVLTITDDDGVPSLAIVSPSPQPEGNAGTTPFVFNVNLSAPSGQTVTVHYSTQDNTATAPSDYTAIPDTVLTFTPGQTNKQITVLVNGDTNFEATETFFVNLSTPVNATIQTAQGTGTIQNDDAAAGTFTINDVRTLEGNSGTHVVTFTVTLTIPNNPSNVTVQYATAPGTATSGVDYQPASGTLVFGAADAVGGTDGGPVVLTQNVNVTIIGDTNKEENETFYVNLSSPSGATLGDSQGVGIIIDEDRAYTSDFDLDRKTDLSVFRPSDGFWYIYQTTNGITKYEHFGQSGDLAVPGDYDGDGKTDFAVFRPSNATWYYERSSDFTFVQSQWGISTDKPVQGDYDGDGKTDIAVFRDGAWYILRSSDNTPQTVLFGTTGDIPVAGDYDGDFKIDVAVFRSGTWYVQKSSNNSVVTTAWGASGDKPVIGDFDGDGSTDYAVFRSGTWFILQSLTGTARTQAFGVGTDIPVVGDYDGDGTSDIAVWRPSTGIWYILRSSDSSLQAQTWGQNGDQPSPAYYQPQ